MVSAYYMTHQGGLCYVMFWSLLVVLKPVFNVRGFRNVGYACRRCNQGDPPVWWVNPKTTLFTFQCLAFAFSQGTGRQQGE